MSARKNRKPGRLPAIVPRFIKSAVTIGAIPALVGCDKGRPEQRVQPVVAQYIDKSPPVVAAYAPDAPLGVPLEDRLPAVVAAMVNPPPPPPPPRPRDAGVDAATHKKQPKAVTPPPPPPPVVAALVGPQSDLGKLPPAVVAAMLPDQNLTGATPPKKPKQTKKP